MSILNDAPSHRPGTLWKNVAAPIAPVPAPGGALTSVIDASIAVEIRDEAQFLALLKEHGLSA